jgi:gliding motility-associated-like protein
MEKIYVNLFLPVKANWLKKALPVYHCLVMMLLLSFLSPFKLAAQAPTISYSTPQTYTAGSQITDLNPISSGVAAYTSNVTSLGSGFKTPYGIAVDKEGNVYIGDSGNGAIKKIPAGNGTPVTIASGLGAMDGIALDTAGNIYVADYANNDIKKIPAGGGTAVTIGSGFNLAEGVAVDAAGNVYVADTYNNAIKKIPVGGGAIVTLGSGFFRPYGVAVDAAGNVYVADTGNTAIKKIPVGGGAVVTLGYGFDGPLGLAVDAAGNVYVNDSLIGKVKRITAGTTGVVTLSQGFTDLAGIAVDASANVYITDKSTTGVQEITKPVSGYFISPDLPTGIFFINSSGQINGTPIAASPATNYVISAFNSSGNGTAMLNITVELPSPPTVSYTSPHTYPEGAAITPLVPTSTNVPNSGSAIIPVTIGSGFSKVYGTTADVSGNVYITDETANTVWKMTGGTGTPAAIGSGFSDPRGITTDAAGNIYVADFGNNAIKKMPAGGGTPVMIGTGFSTPNNVAVDAAGNVYVADLGNNAIKKIAAAGGGTTTLHSGYNAPAGVGVDPWGNVFVADASNTLFELPANGGSQVTVATGFNAPASVTTDPGGNIYIADAGNSVLKKVFAGTSSATTLPYGFFYPTGVAVDAKGDIFMADEIDEHINEIIPNRGYYLAAPLPAGLSLDISAGTISGTPQAITPAANYKIYTYNPAGSASATLNIAISSSAATPTLSSLVLSGAALSPAFVSGTTGYTTSVSNATASITVTPTVSVATSTVKINGTAVASGTASAAIPLNVGANTVTALITAQNGTTTNTYTVTVTRAPSNIATLSGLTVSSGTLTPAFATATTSYTDVAHSVSSIAFRATTTDALATETINGTAVPEGTVSPYIPLSVGVNNISIVVTAQDGVTQDTYTIAVTRLPEIATLSKLTTSSGTLSPAFAGGTTSYTDVAHAVSSIAFRATTTDALGTETINGTAVPEGTVSPYIPLSVGVNNISIVVTAQDGVTTDTYTIAVTRLPEVATLSKLTTSSGTLSPAFASGTTSYTDVAHAVSSIAFRATTTDALATETINGTAVPEGTVSPYIPLSVGVNNISVVITAQDGVTTDTYTIAVTRLPEIATLSKLTISSGTLTPAFATATTSYTDVAHAVSSIAFRATTTDALATETINGTAVPEGTVSPYIPLTAGVNNISIVVTAQDGVTQDTYTVAVTRLPNVATLSKLTVSSGTLTPAFATATTGYTDNVANTVSSIAFRATTTDALATETINGTAVPEGAVSFYVPLSVGMNKIPIIVTAQDGVTTEAYTITVTRAAPPVVDAVYQPVSVEITTETPQLEDDIVIVHQGVSPNGDGVDDFLQIDGILAFPDNRLMIMNRNGMLVYEAKGYDNASKVFDGHSNKNGAMQLPGTYFYSLDYTVNGITKHKTGFLVLKY